MLSNSLCRRAAAAAVLGALATASVAALAAPELKLEGDPEAGKKIVMDRGKGNCIACHIIPGGESPGAIGPALVAMQTRYPSKQALFAQIWDATVKTPDVVMPPFGRHEILDDRELADVTAFIWMQ